MLGGSRGGAKTWTRLDNNRRDLLPACVTNGGRKLGTRMVHVNRISFPQMLTSRPIFLPLAARTRDAASLSLSAAESKRSASNSGASGGLQLPCRQRPGKGPSGDLPAASSVHSANRYKLRACAHLRPRTGGAHARYNRHTAPPPRREAQHCLDGTLRACVLACGVAPARRKMAAAMPVPSEGPSAQRGVGLWRGRSSRGR